MGKKLSPGEFNELKNATWLPSCHSTNSYASTYLKENELTNGWLFFTFSQTDGRGQAGNKWESEPDKNLTFSKVLIAPDIPLQEQFFLNMAVSIALHSVLREFGVEAKIKWPNDAYVKGKKIAGVLIENSLRAGDIRHSVIGIGLNVNQITFKEPKATSMQLETGQEYELMCVLSRLNSVLDEQIATLKKKPGEVVKNYHTHLYQIGESARYRSTNDNETFVGVIQGVDLSGRLVLLTSTGKKIVGLKEIQFL